MGARAVLATQSAMAAEGVEQRRDGRRGIDQGAVVVLAVDFDQGVADRAQGLDADRLVIDEGAAAAVGHLHAAQDQVALDVEALFGGGNRGRDGSAGGSKTATTCPCAWPERTRAPSPRPPSASEKASRRMDLPAPVSPVSTVRPGAEIELQPVDQDDVADRELNQHGPCLDRSFSPPGPQE